MARGRPTAGADATNAIPCRCTCFWLRGCRPPCRRPAPSHTPAVRVRRCVVADGDGKLTMEDVKVHYDKAVGVLSFNLPSGAAFGTAFVLGLRYG